MRIIPHLFFVFVCFLSSFVSANSGSLSGSGTATDPFLIKNLSDFREFSRPDCARKYWQNNIYTKLVCNLDLIDIKTNKAMVAPDSSRKGQPFEFQAVPFAGTFDGNSHTISNMCIISGTNSEYLGMFGKLTGTVKNLNLNNICILAAKSSNYIGSICGENERGLISNCSTNGIISVKDNCYYIGGVCGKNIGGMISETQSKCSMTTGRYCWYIGGLNGYNQQGYITRSCAEINLAVTDCCVGIGGLCGVNTKSGFISNCYSTGKLFGKIRNTFVGGLTGINSHNSYLLNCYTVSTVSFGKTTEHAGGLCGRCSSKIKNCFWNTDCAGITASSGGIGICTTEMQNSKTFASVGWHMTASKSKPATWQINQNQFPQLTFQQFTPNPDMNNDGKVNMLDFALFSNHWMETNCQAKNWCDSLDLDMSGDIDRWDLEIFLNEWINY